MMPSVAYARIINGGVAGEGDIVGSGTLETEVAEAEQDARKTVNRQRPVLQSPRRGSAVEGAGWERSILSKCQIETLCQCFHGRGQD